MDLQRNGLVVRTRSQVVMSRLVEPDCRGLTARRHVLERCEVEPGGH